MKLRWEIDSDSTEKWRAYDADHVCVAGEDCYRGYINKKVKTYYTYGLYTWCVLTDMPDYACGWDPFGGLLLKADSYEDAVKQIENALETW